MTVLGKMDYDTQIGGNTTVPSLEANSQEVVDALEEIVALQPCDDAKDWLTQAQLKLRVSELQTIYERSLRPALGRPSWPPTMSSTGWTRRRATRTASPPRREPSCSRLSTQPATPEASSSLTRGTSFR